MTSSVDAVRSTQRAPRRCTECAQRKVKCSLTIPCEACCRRGIAHSCRREIVSVRGKIVSAPVNDPSSADAISSLQQQVALLRNQVRSLKSELNQERTKHAPHLQVEGVPLHTLRTPPPSSSFDGSVYRHMTPDRRLEQDVYSHGSYSNNSSPPPSQYSPRQPSEPLPSDPDPLAGNSMVDSATLYQSLQPVWHRAEQLHPGVGPEEDALDVHVLLTTVLFGWDESRKLTRNNPIWEYMAEIFDAFQFHSIRKVEVLLMMDYILRVMKLQASGNTKNREVARALLPQFALPTPFERERNHTLLIPKYFPHPGMREHLILNPTRYRRNGFIAAFHSQLRFLFPSIHDAYSYDKASGQLSFSPLWLDRRDSIACWTVTSDFLHWYPEFVDDLPCFDVPPMRVVPSGSTVPGGVRGPFGEIYGAGGGPARHQRFSEHSQVREIKENDEDEVKYGGDAAAAVYDRRPAASPENPRWATSQLIHGAVGGPAVGFPMHAADYLGV